MEMSTAHWWKDADRGNPKYERKNVFQCKYVHYKSHADLSVIELGLLR